MKSSLWRCPKTFEIFLASQIQPQKKWIEGGGHNRNHQQERKKHLFSQSHKGLMLCNDTSFDISLWKKIIFWKSTSSPRDRAFHVQIVPLKCLVEHLFTFEHILGKSHTFCSLCGFIVYTLFVYRVELRLWCKINIELTKSAHVCMLCLHHQFQQ